MKFHEYPSMTDETVDVDVNLAEERQRCNGDDVVDDKDDVGARLLPT